jgi:hypothetical protein
LFVDEVRELGAVRRDATFVNNVLLTCSTVRLPKRLSVGINREVSTIFA